MQAIRFLRGWRGNVRGDIKSDLPPGMAQTLVDCGRAEWVGASPVAVDPTGSGDAYSAAYLAGRSQGLTPVSAARLATGVVSAMLTSRLS